MDPLRVCRLAFPMMLLSLLLACGGGGPTDPDPDDGADPPDEERPIPPPGPHFSVVPFDLEHIALITPVGSNNKILPVAHTYWHSCDSAFVLPTPRPCHRELQPLLAPGDGVVVSVDPVGDGELTVEGPPGLRWWFGHVTPEGLSVGDTVVAGQHVATMYYEHGFDFGVQNFRVEHEFVVPERYPLPARHAQHPIEQFPEPLRSELVSRIVTVDSPPLGRVSYDVAGTASGGWFLEGSPPGNVPLQFGNEHMRIFLGRYTQRLETRIITLGGLWEGERNLSRAVDEDAPDWEDITPDSGRLQILLWHLNQAALPNHDRAGGSVLLEMTDEHRLRLEWFDTHDAVSEFTDDARAYVR